MAERAPRQDLQEINGPLGAPLEPVVGLRAGEEVTISPDRKALAGATQDERDMALASMFLSLTNAIREHGCEVDMSDPDNIKVRK